MRQLTLFVIAALVLVSEAKGVTNLKGPACPEGDGLYAVGCSSKYLLCVNKVESAHSCPEGLYFDRLMARCERRAENYLCKNTNVKNLNVRQKAVTPNCIGRSSGDYPLDENVCNKNYYSCANGTSYMKKPTIKKCDYMNNCKPSDVKNYVPLTPSTTPSYSGMDEPTITPSYPVITDAPFTSGFAQNVNKTTLSPPQNGTFCERLDDGTYGLTCGTYFFICNQFKTFKIKCPNELRYDPISNLCDYKSNIEGCPEFVPTTAQN